MPTWWNSRPSSAPECLSGWAILCWGQPRLYADTRQLSVLHQSELSNQVQKDAPVIKGKIAQVVRETSEIVAYPDFEVLADVSINRRKRTQIGGIGRRHVQNTAFEQQVPLLHEMQVGPQNPKMRRGLLPIRKALKTLCRTLLHFADAKTISSKRSGPLSCA